MVETTTTNKKISMIKGIYGLTMVILEKKNLNAPPLFFVRLFIFFVFGGERFFLVVFPLLLPPRLLNEAVLGRGSGSIPPKCKASSATLLDSAVPE